MDAEELRTLLRRPEGLKLEFKQEFYHIDHAESAVQKREWGEFIKDVLALANGNVRTAGQRGYLIIGVADRIHSDGTRALFDVDDSRITTKRLLEKLNDYCEPPFADITVDRINVDGKCIIVITIPSSPYLHETTQRIDTHKTVYSERTIFVRRSEHIHVASPLERMALADEKSAWANRVGASTSVSYRRSNSGNVSIGHEAQVESYLRGIIQTEQEVLDNRYISLSGTTQQMRRHKTEFPRQLIPNEFRFIDLHQNPKVEDVQLLESIEDALRIHSRFVLLGAPGSGKTLTLRKLRLDTARLAHENAEERIPILINLAQWPDKIDDVPDLIIYECHLKGLPALHFTELLILFDALNEMPAGIYPERVRMIEEWLQANDSAHVVISSRERDYREREKLSIPTVQVYPLDETRAKRLLYAYLGDADAESLLGQLRPDDPARRSNRDLIHLAQNPYLLMMMAYVYRNFGSLPSSRGQLFQLFVKTLYSREEEHRATEGMSYDVMTQALGSLAYAMQRRRSATAVQTTWAAKQITSSFPVSNLWSLGLRASLLEFSKDDSIVQFAHQLLLEYFAAEGLLKQTNWRKNFNSPAFVNGTRRASQWDEVAYTLVGITAPNEILLQISAVDPFLAADCLAHVPANSEISDDTKTSIFNDLISLFESQNPAARAAAITKIASIGEPAVPHLLTVLQSGTQISKRAILQVLALVDSPSASKGLIGALNDQKRWVRRDAAELLEDLVPANDAVAGQAVIDLFLENKTSTSTELLRALAYFCALDNLDTLERVITLIGDDQQGNSVADALLAAGDPLVFRSIFRTLFLSLQVFAGDAFARNVTALRRLADAFMATYQRALSQKRRNPPDVEWVSELLPLAAVFPTEHAHDTAIELVNSLTTSLAIGSLRDEASKGDFTLIDDFIHASSPGKRVIRDELPQPISAVEPTRCPPEARELMWLLNSPSVVTGADAVKKLAALGEVVVEPLIRALQSTNSRLRRRAPRALAKIGDRRAISPLRRLLSDPEERVRHHAAKALAEFNDPSLVQDLLDLLYDESKTVRFHALRGIGRLGNQDQTSAIIPFLADEDVEIVIEASQILLSWGYGLSIDSLTQIALNKKAKANHRVRATRVLGKDGGTAAVKPLIALLSDDNPELVLQAIIALGELKNKQAIESLSQMLSNSDVTVRRNTTDVLGKFHVEEVIEPLMRALSDDDYIVRVSAVDGLGRIGAKSALESLATALLDEDSVLRSHAARALGEIGDPKAIASLSSILDDADEDVLVCAIEALSRLGAIGEAGRIAKKILHESHIVRSSAIRALSMLGSSIPTEVLLHALDDQDPTVQLEAINAVGKLRIREALKPMISCLNSEDSRIRHEAASSLGEMGDLSAMEPLSRLLTDEVPEVRASAAQAMHQLTSNSLGSAVAETHGGLGDGPT